MSQTQTIPPGHVPVQFHLPENLAFPVMECLQILLNTLTLEELQKLSRVSANAPVKQQAFRLLDQYYPNL